MFELTKQFWFDAAHTLNRSVDSESSRTIHGHSYRAEVTIRGVPDPSSGMVIDLGVFERTVEGTRQALDHRFLDDVPDLGPATLENLCQWIWRRLDPVLPNLAKITIHRDSGNHACAYYGPGKPDVL
jgi:6-pyruvoyltetrahydropterin/6-carboxytetrahydropterin synthase